MKTANQDFFFSQKLVVLALLAAFGSAYAAEDEVATLIKPDETAVSIGLAGINGDNADRALFGQHNGWRKHDNGLLLDLNYLSRNDATGLWLNFDARNLGQNNRELSFTEQAQGQWRYSVGYSELVRSDIRNVNSGLIGLGSTSPTVSALATPGAGSNYNLQLRRKAFSVSADRWISPDIQIEASYKTEDKDGARVAGIGGYCSNIITGYPCTTTQGALLMLPEPINSTIQQFELKLNFSGDNYLVSTGYYGSYYQNRYGSMQANISGNLWATDGTSFNPAAGSPNNLASYLTQAFALPPNNQAHQFYINGNYTLTPSIRTNFNVSTTHSKQDDSFASTGLTAEAGLPSSLHGEINTTVAQFGVTARPMPKVSLLANWRYEDIRDDTPIAFYNTTSSNTPNSTEKANGKAEASYQLPDNMRATVGTDYAWITRDRPVASTLIPTASLASLREWTEEVGVRAELRRSMSNTVNAALAVSHSKREGGHWMSLTSGSSHYVDVRDSTISTSTGVVPSTMLDRKRDKVRLTVDWAPIDSLSLQLLVEDGQDTYSAPAAKGLHSADMQNWAIDATYALTDAWKLKGYVNYGEQSQVIDHNAGYIADIKNTSTAIGLGTSGKISSHIEIGGDLSYLDDRNRYSLASGNIDPPGVLPDVTYRLTTVKLFGKYALDANADIRIDFLQQDLKFNEWTWSNAGVPFAYSDSSTVSQQPSQKVTYLGVKYMQRFK